MEMIHRLNSGTATLAHTHTTQREKKRGEPPLSSFLLLPAEMYTQKRSSWWWRAFSPSIRLWSLLDGREQFFFFFFFFFFYLLKKNIRYKNRAGCNILPGIIFTGLLLLRQKERKKMMARFCLCPRVILVVVRVWLVPNPGKKKRRNKKGATFGFVEE